MRILVIGSGGREHALVWKIRQSPLAEEVYCAPGNAGIASMADCVGIEPSDIIELADFAAKIKVDLTVVGPEFPLDLGIVDEFAKRGLRIFGPSNAAAQIESSKVFAKEFMERHGIPTAGFKVFGSEAETLEHLKAKSTRYPLVVKADGLAAGKGVVVAKDFAEAEAAVKKIMTDRVFGTSGDSVIVEECLEGVEVSFTAICDGLRLAAWPTSQDYKRAHDGDEGPNTGGMGCYSPSAYVDAETFKEILSEIMTPTVAGLAKEGRPYKGILYGGVMLTASGPKVLEFNCRLGDPECEALLPRMKSDLVPLLTAAADGALPLDGPIEWSKEAAVTVVLASGGYPGSFAKGATITGAEEAASEGTAVFHCGTKRSAAGKLETAGGRVLAVTGTAPTLEAAARRSYEAASRIKFDKMHFRKDIAAKAIEKIARDKEGRS